MTQRSCVGRSILLAVTVGLSWTAVSRGEDNDAKLLAASLAKWEQAKAACQGNYSYQVRWSSFVGFGHVTTVTVRGNKVVERKFEEFAAPNPDPPQIKPHPPKLKWTETGKMLGSHQEGAAVRTVDELYAEARKVIAQPLPEKHRRYLRFDGRGLLSCCSVVDTRIADDAPETGVPAFQLSMPAAK